SAGFHSILVSGLGEGGQVWIDDFIIASLDSDADGILDQVEIEQGSDPFDPSSPGIVVSEGDESFNFENNELPDSWHLLNDDLAISDGGTIDTYCNYEYGANSSPCSHPWQIDNSLA